MCVTPKERFRSITWYWIWVSNVSIHVTSCVRRRPAGFSPHSVQCRPVDFRSFDEAVTRFRMCSRRTPRSIANAQDKECWCCCWLTLSHCGAPCLFEYLAVGSGVVNGWSIGRSHQKPFDTLQSNSAEGNRKEKKIKTNVGRLVEWLAPSVGSSTFLLLLPSTTFFVFYLPIVSVLFALILNVTFCGAKHRRRRHWHTNTPCARARSTRQSKKEYHDSYPIGWLDFAFRHVPGGTFAKKLPVNTCGYRRV